MHTVRDLMEVWAMGAIVLTAVVHVALAAGVYTIASREEDWHPEREQIAPAWIWAAAALVGGVFAVLAYWLIHLSTLNPQNKNKSE